jgi:uncharacterized protein (TIGR02001 family)
MNKAITGIAMTSLLTVSTVSFQASATEGLSANVAMSSNYLWRGVSQSNGDAAVSGGIDYASDSGFYVGTWVSTASWAPGMTYELDLYGGFSAEINDSMAYDVGFIYYGYPDETSGNADFSEVYANLSLSGLTVGLALLTSGEDGSVADSIYVSADYTLPLKNDIEVAFHVGSYSGDWIADDYIDYGVSLQKEGFTFGASATNLEGGSGDIKVYAAYSIDIDL